MLIDFHSHILPGADHGSDSVETSLAQIKKAKSVGIDVILSTSHYYQHRDSIRDFLARREHCYKKLRAALDEEGVDIKILKAAEVTLEVDLPNDPRLPELCIEGTNYILLEMPMNVKWTDWVYNSVYEIAVRHNVRPIIAHIDRYDEKYLKKLLEMDVLPQINAVSLCNIFQRRKMLKYVREGTVKFLGSDVHKAEAPQYDHFKKALEILGPEYTEQLMQNAAEVLGLSEKKKPNEGAAGGLLLF